MSAPDTNVEKQERKHKASLVGIRGAMIFGAAMMVLLAIYVARNSDGPGGEAMMNSGAEGEGVIINTE